jgi:uncharacterized membrane protein YfcA
MGLVLLIGLVTGGLSNVTSGGAGLVTVFVLSNYGGLATQGAVGTVVCSSVVFVGIGAAEFYRRDFVDRRLSVTVGLSGVVGAIASAEVALEVQSALLKEALGLFTLFLAAYGGYDLIRRRRRRTNQQSADTFPSVEMSRWRGLDAGALFVQILFGLATGVATGLFGVGGGALTLAAFLYLFNLPIETVLGTSLFVSLLRYGAAALPYFAAGYVNLTFFAALAASGAVGAVIGARIITGRRNATNDFWIRLLIVALFLFIGVEFLR